MTKRALLTALAVGLAAAAPAAAAAAAAAGTLKVFVLAGQSNMEGHAEVATVDPETNKPKNGTLKYQLTDPPVQPQHRVLFYAALTLNATA